MKTEEKYFMQDSKIRRKLENENRKIPKKFSMLELVSIGENLGRKEIVFGIDEEDLSVRTAQKIKKGGKKGFIVRHYRLRGFKGGIYLEGEEGYEIINPQIQKNKK